MGRPKGKSDKLSLRPIAERLRQLLAETSKGQVIFADDCIGSSAAEAVAKLQNGDVCLLENLRFYPQEEKNES